MKLVHYSKMPGLKTIDPKYMGSSGVRAEEFKRGIPTVHRAYYYADGTEPEDMVRQNSQAKYHATLGPNHKIYDLGTDPEGIINEALASNNNVWNSDHILSHIKNKGYYGFNNTQSTLPGAVALFYAHPVDKEEMLHKSDDHAYLSPEHYIFSVDNPIVDPEVEKPESPNQVIDLLREHGEDAQLVNGCYGRPEKSIIVHYPRNLAGLHQIAASLGQESGLYSNNGKHQLFFYNGPHAGQVAKGEGTQFFDEKPSDYYTELHTPHGVKYFRHNIDMSPIKKAENDALFESVSHFYKHEVPVRADIPKEKSEESHILEKLKAKLEDDEDSTEEIAIPPQDVLHNSGRPQ